MQFNGLPIIHQKGTVLFGGDWAASTECYYHIYKNRSSAGEERICFQYRLYLPFGIVTWYAMHDDPQKLNWLAIFESSEDSSL